MKPATYFTIGIGIMLAAIWGGSFAGLKLFPSGHWAQAPSFITAFILFAIGVVVIICGFEAAYPSGLKHEREAKGDNEN